MGLKHRMESCVSGRYWHGSYISRNGKGSVDNDDQHMVSRIPTSYMELPRLEWKCEWVCI